MQSSFKVNCILVGAIILWASSFVGIRIALVDYSPGSLALLRFLVASLCMSIVYRNQGIKYVMTWNHKVQLMLAGMLGIGIYNICLNYGEITVSAGIASFIMGLMPVFTVILSLIFLREKIKGVAWVGILISLFGLFLLAMGQRSSYEMREGLFLILLSALTGSILTIIQKKFLTIYQPVTVMAWVMWGGTLLLMIFSPNLVHELKTAKYQSTAAVVYLGIFPAAIAYVAWSYVLKKLPASKASISLYGIPIVSILLGFLLLDEQPSLLSLTGGGIALIGALIAHRFQSQNILNVSVDKKVVAV